MLKVQRILTIVLLGCLPLAGAASPLLSVEQEMEMALKIVGPIKNDDNCESCHTLETEAWQNTRHFATFKDRHRSEEAKTILEAMGERSMKRADDCRQCHYTSEVKAEKLRASFGVTCESCHSPARDWLATHSKAGGDTSAADLKWGTGKDESSEARTARLGAAEALGMIHSEMTYAIAKNCFGCHTVPNEKIVNAGGHKAGSDFDLVAWSQGEVRHNFSSSAGAPDSPTNREATPAQKRRLYVTGLMVDLETSLDNISRVQEKGGSYHQAMVKRANMAKSAIDSVMAAASIPELGDSLSRVGNISADTNVDSNLPMALGEATKAFLANHDGAGLGAIDGLIPTETQGTAY
jgi:hypothetical protein